MLDRLKTEIEAQNWEVLRVQDIDQGLREHYKVDIQNNVVYACKSHYPRNGSWTRPRVRPGGWLARPARRAQDSTLCWSRAKRGMGLRPTRDDAAGRGLQGGAKTSRGKFP